jgi:hypothetical protein
VATLLSLGAGDDVPQVLGRKLSQGLPVELELRLVLLGGHWLSLVAVAQGDVRSVPGGSTSGEHLRAVVKAGEPFTVWYGGDIGEGVVASVHRAALT